jgi:hypothetical protein
VFVFIIGVIVALCEVLREYRPVIPSPVGLYNT